MPITILGIDIAKSKFDCCLLLNSKFKHKVFKNNQEGFINLSSWLSKEGVSLVHACLEATGNYGHELAEFLYNVGHKVSMVNPAQIKGFAQSALSRTKTDKVDAKLIARFCQALQPGSWTPLAPETKQLQALVRRVDALQNMLNQENNRLSVASSVTVKFIQKHITYLENDIKQTKKLIRDHINSHPNLKTKSDLLESIPGIGKATIAVLLGEIRCTEDFSSARKLAAFMGLVPRQFISGSSVRGKSRLCKTGNANLRKALYMPAIVAKQYNPVIEAFCERLKLAGKPPMVIIGAVMRKLVHIIFGVLKSGKPFNPKVA